MSNNTAMKYAYEQALKNANHAEQECLKLSQQSNELNTIYEQLLKKLEEGKKKLNETNLFSNVSMLEQAQNDIRKLELEIKLSLATISQHKQVQKILHQQWQQKLTKAKALAKVVASMEEY